VKEAMEVPQKTYQDLINYLKTTKDGDRWILKLEKESIPCETYYDEDFGE
jgi:hypothetical protein